MGALIRLVAILFVVLTVIYISLSLHARARERDRLRERWIAEGREGDERAFLREGLALYDRSLRRKLILGVYLVPLAVIGTIIYVVNYA